MLIVLVVVKKINVQVAIRNWLRVVALNVGKFTDEVEIQLLCLRSCV